MVESKDSKPAKLAAPPVTVATTALIESSRSGKTLIDLVDLSVITPAPRAGLVKPPAVATPPVQNLLKDMPAVNQDLVPARGVLLSPRLVHFTSKGNVQTNT